MINNFYNVDTVKQFDRDKSYYSHYYKYCLVKPLGNYVSYNIATRVEQNTKIANVYLVLYENEEKTAIKLRYNVKGWWKIPFGNKLPTSSNDYNINLEFVEHMDNPSCDIYRVSVN